MITGVPLLFSGAAAGPATDPYFTNVKLLLHANGANGSTTITDSSTAPATFTANGNTQLTTATVKFGTAALTFDGVAGSFLGATAAKFATGAADFTIEGWIYPTAAENNVVFSTLGGSVIGGPAGFLLYIDTSGHPSFATGDATGSPASSGSFLTGSGTAALNTWHHLAGVRSGDNMTVYLNGVSSGSMAMPYTRVLNHTVGVIGRIFNDIALYYETNRVDEVRLTVGVARYTSDFSVPTAPFPDA